LIGSFAFTSSASLVLSAFDISRLEATTGPKQRETRPIPQAETSASKTKKPLPTQTRPAGASTPDDWRTTAVGVGRCR
jgi:hypothetical protein